MTYSVRLILSADPGEQELAPLASLRRADGTGGWGIRVEAGVIYLGPVLAVPYRGARDIEWRVDGMRHEAWFSGRCAHEGLCDWAPDDADILVKGQDPQYPEASFSGVVTVEVIDG
jgi:hypothetical protein